MLKDDEIRFFHMLEAAFEAVSFAHGRVRGDLDTDRQLVLSLVKDSEIIGEAAAQTTKSTRTLVPEIPWREIAAMRNRLVHAYFSINLDIVWQIVQQDLPTPIVRLDQFVSPESSRC